MRRRVYLAGKWEAQARLRAIRGQLRVRGWDVISTWLDEPFGPRDAPPPHRLAETADKDVREVESADVFVVDTFDVSATGGREVELGVALGRDIPVYVVGPARNIFHYLAWARFDTWPDALATLARGERA